MFHFHICGIEKQKATCPIGRWLAGYDGNDYSNEVMGKWFRQYKRDVQIFICFINHPVHPV